MLTQRACSEHDTPVSSQAAISDANGLVATGGDIKQAVTVHMPSFLGPVMTMKSSASKTSLLMQAARCCGSSVHGVLELSRRHL